MRNPYRAWGVAACAVLLSACATTGRAQASDQQAFDAFAQNLDLEYATIDNRPDDCPEGVDGCFLTEITLTMPDSLPAAAKGDDFAIYYSFVNRLPLVESDVFQNELVNGDLQRLTLKDGATLTPGGRYVLKLWGLGAHASRAFAMPNFYMTGDGVEARVIEATRPGIDPETGFETLPFVQPMTDAAKLQATSAEDLTVWQTPEAAFDTFAARGAATTPEIAILPTPLNAELLTGARVDLRQGVTPALKGLAASDIDAALDMLALAGVLEGSGTALNIRVDPKSGLEAEGYRLTVADDRVEVVAADAAGASHAIESLAQQAAYDEGLVRPFTVTDAPRYPFRGLHIDLARNFHSKEELLKLIDAMALYKLNKLHLHLADDEGWRLEIAALPELTEVGSRRCHDPEERTCLLPQLGAGPEGTGGVNGYLTQADYIDIVKAATARQIEVIPSLDMPGHSRAAIRSMEARYDRLMAEGRREEAERYRLVEPGDTTRYRSIQNYNDNTLNVCIDQTYRFLDTAVDALQAMHKAAGAPLKTFHIGADETAGAWSQSPACKPLMAETGRTAKELGAYFIERVSNDLAKRGLKVAGWSDGLGHTDPAAMPASVQTNIWGTLFTGAVTEAHEQANQGWDVVLSIPDFAYLDMPYVPHPQEGGYDWASRSVDTRQVFGFMTDNLPANAASIKNTLARPQTIADPEPREAGRGIAGVQAQLWSETTRTDAGVDYQLFPRLIALAERGWHQPKWEPAYQPGARYSYDDSRVDKSAIDADWNAFAGRMPVQFALLDKLGVAYRITPPGAKIVDGMLEANTEYPEQAIEYRTVGGAWQAYSGPVAVDGAVEVRARSADGRRASRTVTVP